VNEHSGARKFNRSIAHHPMKQRWRFRSDTESREEAPSLVLTGPWTPEQRAYALWLAVPKIHRQPRHAYQVAQQLGVSKGPLSYWEHQPGFGELVMETTLQILKVSDVADVLRRMVEKALEDGDVAAARLVLQAVGLLDLTQHLQQTLIVNEAEAEKAREREMRREQRRQEMRAIFSKLAEPEAQNDQK
jgi:hypothetical protein